MATTDVQKSEDDKFLYFCYASNLLKSRFHLYVPSAEFVSPAKLDGYRLNFRIYPGWCLETSQWRGSLCSIEQDPKSHVWGAIWRLDKSDVERLYPTLYRYSSPEVTVTTPEGQVYVCHTYHMAPDLEGANEEPPSPHYMKVMIEGAIESKLPESYVNYLRTIKDNGDTTPPPVMDQIYKK